MLKLKNLRLSGIGRFVEEQSVDFTNLGNLIQVDGENRNTNGSSGSGKTTLFNALDYLLGVGDLPVTVLQSRLTKDPISVCGEFDFDRKSLTITRNKRGLSIDLDGEVTEGSSKLSEEKLDSILGMPRDVFRKIIHKRQREGGFFLDFTPKKMYEFLTDCLNLAEERKKLEKVEADLSRLDKLKTASEYVVSSAQAVLSATQESILALGLPPVKDIHQSVVLELKNKYDNSSKVLDKIKQDHLEQNSFLEKQKPVLLPNPILEAVPQLDPPVLEPILPTHNTFIAAFEEKIVELNKEINNLNEQENLRVRELKDKIQSHKITVSTLSHKITIANTAKEEALKVAGEIKKIRLSICPTCEQGWVTETAKTKENELLDKLSTLKTQIQDGSTANQSIDDLKKEIETLESSLLNVSMQALSAFNKKEELKVQNDQIKQERDRINSENALAAVKNKEMMDKHLSSQRAIANEINSNNAVLLADASTKNKALNDEYLFKLTAIRETQNRELDQARGQVDVDRRTLEAAISKLRSYEEAKTRYDNSIQSMKAKESECEEKLNNSTKELDKTKEKLETAEEMKKLVKTFISCSFDDALNSIGDSATRIIRCIPNMANATIQFEGQKETKEGKIKEEVNAVLSVDGEIGVPIKSLSGGERAAIDLAVDLAVVDFIESETGKGFNLYIMDEPFQSLDTINIEQILEIIKNLGFLKKIVIVDHNPVVQEMISNRIIVTRNGEYSSISEYNEK